MRILLLFLLILNVTSHADIAEHTKNEKKAGIFLSFDEDAKVLKLAAFSRDQAYLDDVVNGGYLELAEWHETTWMN
ncbi:MAG: hypothetical protein ABJG41_14935 [Cyclobacteriaceae bacterium]